MTTDDWTLFLQANQERQCRQCGKPDDLWVDHITPKARGGLDELSNLQWLCQVCNRQKGIHPDLYYNQPFYWDAPPNLRRFRHAQRLGAYDVIMSFPEWFRRPFSQINRKLYVPAWVVGSGKTLGTVALACGLNQLILRDNPPGSPRVDRVLVLTKDRALREGLAAAFLKDIREYDLLPTVPRLGIVKNGSQMADVEAFASLDIVVSCLQELFWVVDRPRRGNMTEILARFPLIVIDEPHWAPEQVAYIVQTASTSLCFGFTGTPIDAAGEAMRQYILFSTYGYRDAMILDKSMKYIEITDEAFRKIYHPVQGVSALWRIRGKQAHVEGTLDPDYDKQAVTALRVIEDVLVYVERCDRMRTAQPYGKLADHRLTDMLADKWYPMHAIFRCDSVAMARRLCDSMNQILDQDRAKFPRQMGYDAKVVHAESQTRDDEGERIPIQGMPLEPDHEWLRAKHQKGQLDSECSRFLFVVDMGREGVDNPYCGVLGLCCHIDSRQALAQFLGRPIRGVYEIDAAGVYHVPSAEMDTVQLYSHVTYRNEEVIRWALKYTLNMPQYFEHMPTLSDLVNEKTLPTSAPELAPDALLTEQERTQIATVMGERLVMGHGLNNEQIRDTWGGNNPNKREKIDEWITLLDGTDADKAEARKRMKQVSTLEEIHVLHREFTLINPSDDDLYHFVLSRYPHLLPQFEINFSVAKSFVETMYQDHVERFYKDTVVTSTSLSMLRGKMAAELYDQFGGAIRTSEEKRDLHQGIALAFKKILGVPDDESGSDGSRFDDPMSHAILERPEVQRAMRGWVRHFLMTKGRLPYLAKQYGVAP